jgi:GTP-binding protein HflX
MPQHNAILADLIHFSASKREAEDRMAELEELVRTYGGAVVVKSIQRKAKPDHQTYIGAGKVDELLVDAKALKATLLVINQALKPQQMFNLEQRLQKENGKFQVWDRIDLILNIFEKHARTAEAKLEIELARLRHMGPRIYNMGAQLGRQRGGTGTRGGSGEGNTEAMKRHLRDQEHAILKKLEKYQGVRDLQRERRSRMGERTVALVGYTNAGKTSLLNALTKRKEYAANALFATLDTRVGELYLPSIEGTALLSDTIGFIQGLPPSLIAAFRSTLSEAIGADVLLHVIDAADDKRDEKIDVVDGILTELGIPLERRLRVYNKIDALGPVSFSVPEGAIAVSAHTGAGLDALRSAIADRFPHGA